MKTHFWKISLARAAGTLVAFVSCCGISSAQLPKVAKEEPANTDPWRAVAGQTNQVFTGSNWFTLFARVSQVFDDGALLLRGVIGGAGGDEQSFILRNYPRKMVDGDRFVLYPRAKLVGTASYTTPIGARATVRVFDYGRLCAAPAPAAPRPLLPGEIAAANERAARDQAATEARLLKYHQDQAAAGSVYGRYEMALRYWDGRGVQTNRTLARAMMQNLADDGHQPAKATLAKWAP